MRYYVAVEGSAELIRDKTASPTGDGLYSGHDTQSVRIFQRL
jgi:hypothetical protein